MVQTFDPDAHVLRNATGMRFYDGFNTGVTLEDMQVCAQAQKQCCILRCATRASTLPLHKVMICIGG